MRLDNPLFYQFGQLQDGIIGRGKLPVRREARQPGVGEIPGDHGAQASQFSTTASVGLDPVLRQELREAHVCLRQERWSHRLEH